MISGRRMFDLLNKIQILKMKVSNVLLYLYCPTVTSNRKADSLMFTTNNLLVDLS
jgi:hypothetical protein